MMSERVVSVGEVRTTEQKRDERRILVGTASADSNARTPMEVLRATLDAATCDDPDRIPSLKRFAEGKVERGTHLSGDQTALYYDIICATGYAEALEEVRDLVPELLGELDAQAARVRELEETLTEAHSALIAVRSDRPSGHSNAVWLQLNLTIVKAAAVLAGGKQ